MKTRSRFGSAPVLLLGALALGACGEPAPDAGTERGQPSLTAGRAVTLEAVQALGVTNAAMPLPGLVTAGQPSEEQFQALVDLGYTNFISLRDPSEQGAGWEEALVLDEGVSFARVPVSGAAGMTRESVAALAELLDEAEGEGTVLYCGSGNRAGGMLALKSYWVDGADPAEALELGREAGLRSLEPAVAELMAAPR